MPVLLPEHAATDRQQQTMMQMMRLDIAKGILPQLAAVEYQEALTDFKAELADYYETANEAAQELGLFFDNETFFTMTEDDRITDEPPRTHVDRSPDGETTFSVFRLKENVVAEYIRDGKLPEPPKLAINSDLAVQVAMQFADNLLARYGFLKAVKDEPHGSTPGNNHWGL